MTAFSPAVASTDACSVRASGAIPSSGSVNDGTGARLWLQGVVTSFST